MTTMTLGHNARLFAPLPATGFTSLFSEDADALREKLDLLRTDQQRSATGQRWISEPGAALLDAYNDPALAADSEYTKPTADALSEALRLIGLLPTWAEPPCPVIEPSGAIALTWDRGPHQFLAFAVDGTRRLEHSAVLGEGALNEAHGADAFTGDHLPATAFTLLWRLLSLHA
jgi:hypothetical protein